MKAREIRRRTTADLKEEVRRLRQEIFDKNFRAQTEEKAERGVTAKARKDVARILTVLSERDRADSAAGSVPAAKKED